MAPETPLENGIERDPGMDIGALISNSNTGEPKTNNSGTETTIQQTSVPEQKPLSALDRAIQSKNSHENGFVVDEKSEREGSEPLRSLYQSDEREEAFADELTEQKELADKASLVYVIKEPANEGEKAKMITEISGVTVDGAGIIHVPAGAEFILPKNPEVVAAAERKMAAERGELPEGEVDQDENTYSDVSPEDAKAVARKDEKDRVVKILIDKTGLGANFSFDDEEKKEIIHSNVIHLVEVENQNLSIVDVTRPENGTSFLQSIDTYQLSVSKVPMTFPASGFKADMCGLSWGEFSDITLDVSDTTEDYLSFDKIYKKLSVIYNKMKNISIGAFSSFEQFLKHFAYSDVAFATYGLLIATQPEKDTITLTCNKPSCKKGFNHAYIPRNIIDWESASVELLTQIEKINSAKPEERLSLAENSRVNKFRRIQLPRSQYLVDLGFASCYDYLYGILSLVNKYQADDLAGDDPRWELSMLLQGIRAIYIPQRSGGYVEISNPEDIIEVLVGAIPPDDIIILNSAYQQYINQYYVGFSLRDIECPHCKTKTPAIPITPDELVFLIHQRQRGTQITFDNFQDF